MIQCLVWLCRNYIERKQDEPFMMVLQYKAPHRPWQPDTKYETLWDDVEFPYPATFNDDYKGRELTAGDTEMTMEYFSRRDMKYKEPENLKGKDAVFKITVKAVEAQQLPEIDADFVKLFGLEEGGIEELKASIESGKTYCLLGSSGVGKSSLLNSLAGKPLMKTREISDSSDRGKHVTTHRELRVLDHGGIIIDNPGMREIGMTDSTEGLESTFERILELSRQCRFKDCTHNIESGCAVIAAVEDGEIDNASYENYLKMEREKDHYESTTAEKRQKDKSFGKMVKNVMKHKKKF